MPLLDWPLFGGLPAFSNTRISGEAGHVLDLCTSPVITAPGVVPRLPELMCGSAEQDKQTVSSGYIDTGAVTEGSPLRDCEQLLRDPQKVSLSQSMKSSHG